MQVKPRFDGFRWYPCSHLHIAEYGRLYDLWSFDTQERSNQANLECLEPLSKSFRVLSWHYQDFQVQRKFRTYKKEITDCCKILSTELKEFDKIASWLLEEFLNIRWIDGEVFNNFFNKIIVELAFEEPRVAGVLGFKVFQVSLISLDNQCK